MKKFTILFLGAVFVFSSCNTAKRHTSTWHGWSKDKCPQAYTFHGEYEPNYK